MNCDDARLQMMDRLYESPNAQKESALDTHLRQCCACAQEWREVQEARRFMQRVPTTMPPPAVQDTVLRKSRSRPMQHSQWRIYSIAASFLIVCGATIFAVQNMTPKINEQSGYAPKAEISQGIRGEGLKSPYSIAERQERRQSDAKDTGVKETLVANTLDGSHGEAMLARASAPDTSKGAEKSFRTALENYNRAFSMVGEERKALLRSAIVFLKDIEQRFPEQRYWLALSYILIADAHRELGEIEHAIGTYEHMVKEFSDVEPYCEQAQVSMIRLCLEQEEHLHRIAAGLKAFHNTYPESKELPSLAYRYASLIQAANEEEALEWIEVACKSMPAGHIEQEEAYLLREKIEEKAQARHTIQDWFLLGPLPITAQPYDSEMSYFPLNPTKRYAGHNPNSLTWKPYKTGENGEFNLDNVYKNLTPPSCVFATTAIYSPETRLAYLKFENQFLRMWMNQEPIVGINWSHAYMTMVQVQLKEGWNDLTVKFYISNKDARWNQPFILLDAEGFLLRDVKVNPMKTM